MKTLYMVRHAKSSWEYDVIDHQRPLKDKGKNDAMAVSEEVKTSIIPPQKMISSDAVRALTTAHYFKDALEISDADFSTNHDLYDFSGQNVMRIIKGLDNSLDRVMLFGHNHAFTSIANMLGSIPIENVPTCGFFMIEFDTDTWSEIKTGKTVRTIFPRDVK
ncbi:SixA phosphatase family protein [Ulvibacter litoralis]|uniref:Phosphohistidine phosphatase n=1 Tax=Ulvibacter litoralis TaxID=227084 RepID=A0A1G7FT79_9FLAO|nr:histidine phosphatase family protein [Ulvibacter litoralis]GHC63569.1 phosphohistidine phosphatase SixA [Ulvibacter litoralis]SDE79127.1 phosphohistidine phosphatase [Ulvibacter litoralis]